MAFRLDLEGFENLLPEHVELAKSIIDLRDCEFIRPDGALGVFLLLRYWIQIGKRPILYRPQNPNVDSYFERTGVPILTQDDVDYSPDIKDIIFRSWTERNTMNEIIRITDEDNAARVVDKFVNALKVQNKEKVIVKKLRSAMIESFQNMPQHANPKSPLDFEGYANLQAYDKQSRVVVAAGDLGVGIKKSLMLSNLYSRLFLRDIDAIRMVANKAASRFDEEGLKSRGGGIQMTIKNINSVKGSTLIRSGTAALIIDPYGNQRELPKLKYFPGTQINITVRH